MSLDLDFRVEVLPQFEVTLTFVHPTFILADKNNLS